MKNKKTKQNESKEKMKTILEEESDEEDHITNKQQPIKQESEEEPSDSTEGENLANREEMATREEMPQIDEVPTRRDTIPQESRIQRRGE